MRKYLTLYIIFILSQLFIAEANAERDLKLEETDFYTPQLDNSFLYETQRSTYSGGKEELLVRDYSLSTGLFAGYNSKNDQRLLFISSRHSGGEVNARILYFDEMTQSVVPAFTLAGIRDGYSSGIKILVGGQDLLGLLQKILRNPREISEEQLELQSFLTSKIGQAMLESIPLIYTELEAVDRSDSELAGLKAPFGAMRMALDVITGSYHGYRELESMPLSDYAKTNLVTKCESDLCAYRTSQFMVHQYGLFDVLTNFNSLHHCQQRASGKIGVASIGEVTSMSYSNDCFGYCGPGCNTPGNVITSQCAGHDQCVCEYSHLQCMLASPSNCGNDECEGSDAPAGHCNSLVSAIISYVAGLFGFGDSWDDWTDVGIQIPDLPWDDVPCDPLLGCEPCYYDINCYPSYDIGV